jgi:putative endonuclease
MWFLYVLRCTNDALYTGITTDVERRFEEHRAGQGARYTRQYPPEELLAVWPYPDRSQASSAEHAFKQLSRMEKLSRIEERRPLVGAPFDFERFEDHRSYRFCPRCGGALTPLQVGQERVPVCTVCGRRNYVNAKPAAGMLLLREGRVLLVHRNLEPYLGYWDIPGGFLQEEELPAAGALREVAEETGLRAHIVDFLGFYMDHYDYQGDRYAILNIYFVGAAEGEPTAGDDADGWRWFPLDDLPEQVAFEHAGRVLADLCRWADGRAER